ncbi:MAG: molybdopterin molybdotransferase MoeA [Alphaproteobacteria bacterium]|nr:molybdopterin molybdotransferase MoeA [Alphaproteobacteria bacterium]
MAQLKDDCFAFVGGLVPLPQALETLLARVTPVAETEEAPLSLALGRTLAADVIALRDVPPHDNSAVDGYAVCFADVKTDGETALPVTGRVAAGHPLDRPAGRGEAIRIFTGAPIPAGDLDTVYMEEDVRAAGDRAYFPPGLKKGSNLRKRAEDIKAGTVILARGRRLKPHDLGVAASVGRAALPVFRRLKAAVFSTGDEVRDPGAAKGIDQGCIFDANRFAIIGLLKGLGCEVSDLGILPDREDAIRAALVRVAPAHDLLVTSGGVSAGEEDHVKAALEGEGGTIHLWRLAIKPGRPVAFGTLRGAAFVGLPGNPVAAMATFMRIARPMILRLGGANGTETEPLRYRVKADFSHGKKAGRREWVRARLVPAENGAPMARKTRGSGSGILTSMTAADGLVELSEAVEDVAAGDEVDFLPFAELLA